MSNVNLNKEMFGGQADRSPTAFNNQGRFGTPQQPQRAMPQQSFVPPQQQQSFVAPQQQQAMPAPPQAPVQQQQQEFAQGYWPPATSQAKAPPGMYSFGAHQTYRWKNGTADGAFTESTPLVTPLQHQNLSTTEQFNVANAYVESVKNVSDTPIGVQFVALNGKDIKKNWHENGQWSTVMVQPNQLRDFSHHNAGKGLLVHSNPLDDYGNVNVQMSPADLLKSAAKHPDYVDANGDPTHYVVGVDFTAFGQRDLSLEDQLKPMSPLGKIVYANAKAKFNNIPGIEQLIGGPLPPLDRKDIEGVDVFPTLEIRPDTLAARPGRFHAIVQAQELKDAVDRYGQDVQKTAQPTSALTHKIKIVALTKNGFDSKNEIGVSPADVERSKSIYNGVHVAVNYDIQHNGKPFSGEKKL